MLLTTWLSWVLALTLVHIQPADRPAVSALLCGEVLLHLMVTVMTRGRKNESDASATIRAEPNCYRRTRIALSHRCSDGSAIPRITSRPDDSLASRQAGGVRLR